MNGPVPLLLCGCAHQVCWASWGLEAGAIAYDASGPKEGTADKGAAGGSANMMEPFPQRTKCMHYDTYAGLFWDHHEAEMAQLASMREWAE